MELGEVELLGSDPWPMKNRVTAKAKYLSSRLSPRPLFPALAGLPGLEQELTRT